MKNNDRDSITSTEEVKPEEEKI